MVICLSVAVALSTQHLLATAQQLPFGTRRDVLVAGAEALDDQANAFYLDRPDRFVQWLIGRDQPGAPLVAAPESGPEAAETINSLRSDTVPPDGSPPAPAPTTIPASPTNVTAAPTTTPPAPQAQQPALVRPVTSNDKFRLWAGGDSLGEYVGNQFLYPLADPELAEIALDFQISTGLARPDYFDWPAQLQAVMSQSPAPEALVFMIGGNDNQNMEGPDGLVTTASPEWYAEYRRRAAQVMDITSSANQFYWIGLPPMRDPVRQELSAGINTIIAEEAAARPWVTYIDTVDLFTGPDGGYSTNINDPDGRQRVARAADGVHITLVGSQWVADEIWSDITERWRFPR